MNYDRFINQRVKNMPKSGIRRFFDIASELDDCISLGVGEPISSPRGKYATRR